MGKGSKQLIDDQGKAVKLYLGGRLNTFVKLISCIEYDVFVQALSIST